MSDIDTATVVEAPAPPAPAETVPEAPPRDPNVCPNDHNPRLAYRSLDSSVGGTDTWNHYCPVCHESWQSLEPTSA